MLNMLLLMVFVMVMLFLLVFVTVMESRVFGIEVSAATINIFMMILGILIMYFM